MLDFLLKNGSYPDFEAGKSVEANIGIKDGKIAYIGREEVPAAETVECKGRIVSPGFIDIHMHEENFNHSDDFIISKYMVKQGVTTCVGGNCGVVYQTVSEFRDALSERGGAPVNYLMMSGYNSYRGVLGLKLGHFDAASGEQRRKISEMIKKDIDAGAIGISFGIEYDPGITTEEIIEAVSGFGEGLLVAAHYRNDCIDDVKPVEEMIEIQSGIKQRFQISHLSSCSALGQMKSSLKLINDAIEKDPRLNYDTYPYNAFCTEIGSAVFDEGCFETWKKTYSDVLLTGEPYKNQFANKESFEDCRKNYPAMLAVAFVMNEDEITAAITNKYGMVASDGILNHGNGHPRAAGTFPRVLGKYVRVDNKLDMLTALRKMTSEPAKRLGLDGTKGMVKLGYDADITIFNPDAIIDGPTFEDIGKENIGIDMVIVDGKIAVKQNAIISETAGKFISYRGIHGADA